jgi:hypothetical protein
MDEELRVYLAAMEQRMTASILQPINTKMDDILDRLSRQQEDLHAIRGHALFQMEDGLTMSRRITKLEDELRQLRSGSV